MPSTTRDVLLVNIVYLCEAFSSVVNYLNIYFRLMLHYNTSFQKNSSYFANNIFAKV